MDRQTRVLLCDAMGPATEPRSNDYYSPEVDSTVIPLPGVKTSEGASCASIRDTAEESSWAGSFKNIQCYDALRVNALLNQIAGKTHNGAAAQVPAVFGMNFQAVYTGRICLRAGRWPQGGYQNAAALPSEELLKEIEFVDASIGDIVNALKDAGIYDDTLIIITRQAWGVADRPGPLRGGRHQYPGDAAGNAPSLTRSRR